MFFKDLLTDPLTQRNLSIVLNKCIHIREDLLRIFFFNRFNHSEHCVVLFWWFGLAALQCKIWDWVAAVLSAHVLTLECFLIQTLDCCG